MIVGMNPRSRKETRLRVVKFLDKFLQTENSLETIDSSRKVGKHGVRDLYIHKSTTEKKRNALK